MSKNTFLKGLFFSILFEISLCICHLLRLTSCKKCQIMDFTLSKRSRVQTSSARFRNQNSLIKR